MGLPIVVYGAGGHGRVIIDMIRQAPEGQRLLGVLDDGVAAGSECAGLAVLGGQEWLSGRRDAVVVALGVGDNRRRAALARCCAEHGIALFTAIHPRAAISEATEIGDGTVVMAGAVVNIGARIGRGCIVNSGAVVEHDCRLGDFAHASPNSTMGGSAELGSFAQLGLSACILPGVSVGEGAMVGAGAVVNRTIPARAVAFGVPARVQGLRHEQ